MSVLTDLLDALRAIVFRSRGAGARGGARFHVDMDMEQRRRSGLDGTRLVRSLMALAASSAPRGRRDARGTRLLQDSTGDFMYACARWHGAGASQCGGPHARDRQSAHTAVFSAVDAAHSAPALLAAGDLVRLYMSYGKEADVAGS